MILKAMPSQEHVRELVSEENHSVPCQSPVCGFGAIERKTERLGWATALRKALAEALFDLGDVSIDFLVDSVRIMVYFCYIHVEESPEEEFPHIFAANVAEISPQEPTPEI